MLVDTHCHLNFDSFDVDRSAVVERARQNGVTHILNPGIDLITSRQVLALTADFPQVFAAVGVHPTDARSWEETTAGELRSLAQHTRVKAIGEIGLDYYWDKAPQDLQKVVLGAQLELAAELGLPVVIHARNASPQDRRCTAELMEILENWVNHLQRGSNPLSQRPGVLHSFSDQVVLAQRAVDLNFYLGVTGPVTFRKAEELRQVATEIALERLLIETDAPFLTPHPHRGERNEPAYVRFVAEKIAKINDLSLEVVAETTTANAARLFQW